MNKRKVFVCCCKGPSIGGIDKTLITFLQALSRNNCEITLLLDRENKFLKTSLADYNIKFVHLLDISHKNVLKNDIKHFDLFHILKGFYYRIKMRFDRSYSYNKLYSYRSVSHAIVPKDTVDVAISYVMGFDSLDMALCCKAKKHIAFVHGDCRGINEYILAHQNPKTLLKFDKIYCVSETIKASFAEMYPMCTDILDTFYNIFDAENVKTLSCEPATDMILDDILTLCTVGRLSIEKGQDLIPKCAKILLSEKIKFRWYIVGEGPFRTELEKAISDNHLEDNVILLGLKTNPYPYIKNCDIYVQTYYTESYCMSIREALALEKIIVSTNFPAISEQISDGVNGLVAEMSPESLASNILHLLTDKNLEETLKKNLSKPIKTHNGIEKLDSFIKE